jgi:alkaline phosphatase
MSDFEVAVSRPNRRAFIRNGSLFLLGAGLGSSTVGGLFAEDFAAKRRVRMGLVTDMHYADKAPAGSRHYRESLAKLSEAAEQFQKQKPEHVVELGDLIDAADSVAVEKGYLKRINTEFAALPGKKHYVLGNHCVYTLMKDEFLAGVGQKKSYYSFNSGGFHFVVLDSCFRGDGKPYGRRNFQWTDPNIPAAEVEWLKADLKSAKGQTIVFAHQRLDVSNHYGVKNAAEVRKVLENSGKVLAVFQGHSHKNDYKEIAGIHYCVLAAMIEGSGAENNGYSIMDIFEGGSIRITGFRKQKNRAWS